MAFAQHLVTPSSVAASSTYAGSNIANSIKMAQALTTADLTTCSATAGGETVARQEYKFAANFILESVVLISLPTADGS